MRNLPNRMSPSLLLLFSQENVESEGVPAEEDDIVTEKGRMDRVAEMKMAERKDLTVGASSRRINGTTAATRRPFNIINIIF